VGTVAAAPGTPMLDRVERLRDVMGGALGRDQRLPG